MATLRMATAAITAAHSLAGEASPCSDRIVKTAMQGFARQAAAAGHVARQAQGLTADAVATIRGALNGHADTCQRAARDMALVSVMADGGLRRSEAAALECGTFSGKRTGPGGSRSAARRRIRKQVARLSRLRRQRWKILTGWPRCAPGARQARPSSAYRTARLPGASLPPQGRPGLATGFPAIPGASAWRNA